MSQRVVIITAKDAKRFCEDCLVKVGAKETHASILADLLVEADLKGHYSQGVTRLDIYLKEIEKKIVSNEEPIIIKETDSTALVDARNCLGPVAGDYSMNIAIKKAKNTGVAWVVVKNSNHLGIGSHYGSMAAKVGMIGLAFTNSSPLVFPTRSKAKGIGNNTITCCAKSTERNNDFELDMSTTSITIGKLEIYAKAKDKIPIGWAANKDGLPTDDPVEGLKGGLYPLGGTEETGGYKGFGLSMMVDLFCGILGGSNYGSKIQKWSEHTEKANLGQCYVVINPDMFEGGFSERLNDFAKDLKGLPRLDEKKPILIPGDDERIHINQSKILKGIPYILTLINHFDELGDTLKVDKMHRHQVKI